MELTADVKQAVGNAVLANGIVDVSCVAEEVRLRHEHRNIAREDIEAVVVQCGTSLGAPMVLVAWDDLDWVPGSDRPTLRASNANGNSGNADLDQAVHS